MTGVPDRPARHDRDGHSRVAIGADPVLDSFASAIPVASPADVGLAPDMLEQVDRLLVTEQAGTYSLLVGRHGRLVFERYYHGYDQETRFDVRSVTKSVLSLLVGCAIDDGLLSLPDTLGHLIPEHIPVSAPARVGTITVEHLLSMTAGFAWDDLDDYGRLVESDDWIATVLHTPLIAAPGATFTYNSGCSQILSAILLRHTGRHLADLAEARLFRPMGIVPGVWPADPQGLTIGAFGLRLRARDMLKLGMLVLRKGLWEGHQLVPDGYLRAATTRQSDGGFPEGGQYGYHWWTMRLAGHHTIFAAGYGGQYICAIPDLDLVVVTTALWQRAPDELSQPNVAIKRIVEAASA